MKIKALIQNLKENKIKLTIVSVVLAVALIGGLAVTLLNTKEEEEVVLNEPILSEEKEEAEKEEQAEVTKEPEEIKTQEEQEQVQNQEQQNTNAVNEEVKPQANNGSLTYKSEKLGIAFDMPESWRDKYAIKDDGTSITVYMKHEENFDNGKGRLFTITSNINDYSNGDHLDSLGTVPKHSKIGGREFLIGGPTDFCMSENDPLLERYLTMSREAGDVAATIRQV